MKKMLLTTLLAGWSIARLLAQNSTTLEAESGTLGSEFTTATQSGVTFIRATTDLVASGNPGTPNRVVTYNVTFPVAGTYHLYARIRVGAAGANDDSYFYGNGFGLKTVAATGTASDNDWILANNLSGVGDTTSNTIVTGSGSFAANNIWKWVNMSLFNGGEGPVSFTVTPGNLTQTFQVGGRENGLDFDKFVFGLSNYYYTVKNLDNGEPGSTIPPPPPYTPSGPPIATGKSKWLGCAYSAPQQKINFGKYWNQVTPENGGKWGTVEAVRNVMNWSEMDSAYKLAKDSGYPFKMHTLIWGSQQPAWIETLPADSQLFEIKQWFAAVAARYPAIDFIEVVNEPTHQPPNHTGNGGGNYINALGGSGATGWDWIITSFQLARQYFPTAKLWINDYSVINSTATTATYTTIVNLLKARNLIDGVGEQGHAFTTAGTSLTTLNNNLNTLAATGLPLYITELDIDGPPAETPVGDTIQLREYQRVFPLFWEHPAIKGITIWGYRPGHWRAAQGAPLVYANGAEKAAMVWLKQYVRNTVLPVKLKSFEVKKVNRAVDIAWTTTNEVNSDYYEIERSGNGVNYTVLLTVKSVSSLQTDNSYHGSDAAPLPAVNYYRLVQVDKDGRKTYYGVRVVNFSNKPATVVQVYPNPATTSFSVRTIAEPFARGSIQLLDVTGKMLRSQQLQASGMHQFSTNQLASGTYFLRVEINGIVETSEVVIKR